MIQDLLEKAIKSRIEEDKSDQIGPLSSSNALLHDGYNFISEDSSHCPRYAMLRRIANIQEDKSEASFISNMHGRTFEQVLRDLLYTGFDKKPPTELFHEEEALIEYKDEDGNIVLTARPDEVGFIADRKIALEVKTIQSNNTAYGVFIKEKPKMGALLQVAINMSGHECKEGYILYCASNWFSGFAGKTRWKVNPSFKIYSIVVKNDLFYCENKPTIVSLDDILRGAFKFQECKFKDILPAKPLWRDIHGDVAKYEGCEYCFAKEKCLKADAENMTKLSEFFNLFKEDDNAVISE